MLFVSVPHRLLSGAHPVSRRVLDLSIPPLARLVPPAGHLVRWLRERDGTRPQCYAPFRALPVPVVCVVLDALGVVRADRFVDFGSGDGRLLAGAAGRGADAVGVEVDPGLVAASRAALAHRYPALVASRRLRVLHEPIGWRAPTGMTVGFINLLPFAGRYLLPQLLAAALPGARIGTVDEGFFPANLPVARVALPERRTLFIHRLDGRTAPDGGLLR